MPCGKKVGLYLTGQRKKLKNDLNNYDLLYLGCACAVGNSWCVGKDRKVPIYDSYIHDLFNHDSWIIGKFKKRY